MRAAIGAPADQTNFVKRPPPNPHFPSKDELVAFIGRQPGKVGTREIARAFGLKNADRAALKRMLRELGDDGVVERRRKKLHPSGTLPHVVMADITARDRDGELIAVPTEWDEEAHGAPPKIRIRTFRARRGRAKSPASATARCCGSRKSRRRRRRHPLHRPRHQDHRPRQAAHARHLPRAAGRRRPALADRQEAASAASSSIPAGASGDAQDGDLVAVETAPPRRGLGLADRARGRAARLAQERAGGEPDRDPRPRHPACVSAGRAQGGGGRAAALRLAGREDWRKVPFITIDPADAKDHDDAVHAEPDSDPKNPGGHVCRVAIADVAGYVRPGSALDREARVRGNSVYFPDRVVPMLPERISNDLCSLRPHEDRAALAVRMVVGADGRKRSHTLPSRADPLRREAQLPAGAGAPSTAGPTTRPVRCSAPCSSRSMPPIARVKRARDERAPLDLDIPERKIVLTAHNTVDRVMTPERLDSPPADRGVHDPRQCRRRRDAGARRACR